MSVFLFLVCIIQVYLKHVLVTNQLINGCGDNAPKIEKGIFTDADILDSIYRENRKRYCLSLSPQGNKQLIETTIILKI